MPKAQNAHKDQKTRIIDAALKLSAAQGWSGLSLTEIASEAGLSISDIFDEVQDKTDILVLFGRQVDKRVLDAIGEADPALSARDQLFDILMERFEILNEYRAGLVPILESFRFDPKQAVISCPYLCRSMTWMLEAAGIETSGLRGALKVTGLTALYLKTLRVWRDDESTDLAMTMAALDKDLGRVEQFANTLGL